MAFDMQGLRSLKIIDLKSIRIIDRYTDNASHIKWSVFRLKISSFSKFFFPDKQLSILIYNIDINYYILFIA